MVDLFAIRISLDEYCFGLRVISISQTQLEFKDYIEQILSCEATWQPRKENSQNGGNKKPMMRARRANYNKSTVNKQLYYMNRKKQ